MIALALAAWVLGGVLVTLLVGGAVRVADARTTPSVPVVPPATLPSSRTVAVVRAAS